MLPKPADVQTPPENR